MIVGKVDSVLKKQLGATCCYGQYSRIVHKWVSSIGLESANYGTHTMRRTKASLIYRRTKNLRAVQLLLGHTKLESTVRYLGIEVDDALELAEQTEV
jgi:integrase